MALRGVSWEEVMLLGWTEPREYEAGVGEDARTGRKFNWKAGKSFRVWAGTGDHDVDELKVKTENCDGVFEQLSLFKRGDTVRVGFTSHRECVAVEPVKAK